MESFINKCLTGQRQRFSKHPAQTPLEYASIAQPSFPAAAKVIEEICQTYVSWRYGAQPPKLNQLRRRWQDLKELGSRGAGEAGVMGWESDPFLPLYLLTSIPYSLLLDTMGKLADASSTREQAHESEWSCRAQTVDLTNCDEPIHIPGSIQPHGTFRTKEPQLQIIQVSNNTFEILGLHPRNYWTNI